MSENNGSKVWMLFVRITMILLGIIQAGLLYWVKFVTSATMETKQQIAEAKSDMAHLKDDIAYIRLKVDSLFELRRK